MHLDGSDSNSEFIKLKGDYVIWVRNDHSFDNMGLLVFCRDTTFDTEQKRRLHLKRSLIESA